MTMTIEDLSGQPRRNDELIEAREAIKKELINPKSLAPILVYYLTIINAIDELLERRSKDVSNNTK